jgi:hypothetical protein
MNGKYLRYFLMGAVVFIWGVIVVRIVYGLGEAKTPALQSKAAADPEITIEVDSFTLNADYPDPFLPEKDGDDTASKTDAGVKTGNAVSPATGPAVPPAAGPAVTKETVRGIIQYKGLFGNPKKRNAIAIVVIHGKSAIVREKDRVEGIYIEKIGKAELHIVYKGLAFTVDKGQ